MEYINDHQLKTSMKDIMDKLRFYKCDDCKDLYFGGEAACNDDFDPDAKNAKKLCNKCGVLGKQDCEKHGTKYMIYKCSYCCNNSSVWLCSNTNFCEPCHRNAFSTPIKPCPGLSSGPDKCPLGIEHPENAGRGQRFCIGCAMCLPQSYLKKLKWIYANQKF